MRACRAAFVGGSSRKNPLVRGDDEAVLAMLIKSGVLEREDKLGDGDLAEEGELAFSVILHSKAAI
ncbi:hypothetical protein RRF57_000319 [Xylaria bambusicola]|uniref:Uncharacterized protein n=1 Tax=Xylaria bambusicola TaxID=326684 RepID=A0AAN7UAH8_9PEZI